MTLNLDDFTKSIKTHSIILDGEEYVAKPLTLQELMEIQELYENFDETGDETYEPLRIFLEKVGYPADAILNLPVQAVMEVQRELFLSLTEAVKNLPEVPKKKN